MGKTAHLTVIPVPVCQESIFYKKNTTKAIFRTTEATRFDGLLFQVNCTNGLKTLGIDCHYYFLFSGKHNYDITCTLRQDIFLNHEWIENPPCDVYYFLDCFSNCYINTEWSYSCLWNWHASQNKFIKLIYIYICEDLEEKLHKIEKIKGKTPLRIYDKFTSLLLK